MSGYVENKVLAQELKWRVNQFTPAASIIGEGQVQTFDALSASWNLRIYAAGLSEETKEFVGISLYKKSPKLAQRFNVQFAYVTISGKVLHFENHSAHNFTGKVDTALISSRFLRHSDLTQLGFKEGTRFRLKCTLSKHEVNISPRSVVDFHKPKQEVLDHMRGLYLSTKFADIHLEIGSHTIFAHKNILQARSGYFQAMFAHEMKESKTGGVLIEDVKLEVMQQVMLFMYTGSFDEGYENLIDLSVAADRFQIPGLKDLCGQVLSTKITQDNVCSILTLADVHNMEFLKDTALAQIKLNLRVLMENSALKDLSSVLMHNVLEHCAGVNKKRPTPIPAKEDIQKDAKKSKGLDLDSDDLE